MSAQSEQVQGALKFLLRSINKFNETSACFQPEQVASACYGLRSMSVSDAPVVGALVHALTNAIDVTSITLSNTDFAMAINGLRVSLHFILAKSYHVCSSCLRITRQFCGC